MMSVLIEDDVTVAEHLARQRLDRLSEMSEDMTASNLKNQKIKLGPAKEEDLLKILKSNPFYESFMRDVGRLAKEGRDEQKGDTPPAMDISAVIFLETLLEMLK